MTDIILSLKKDAADAIRTEIIDWGNCIPDCGKCCHGECKELSDNEADNISKILGIPKDSFIGVDEKKDTSRNESTLRKRLLLKIIDNRCIFLYKDSLCLIYDFKPAICTRYGSWLTDCKDYRMITELRSNGSDIVTKLKKMWLAEKNEKDYNRVKWRVRAELFVQKMHINNLTRQYQKK